MCNCDHIVNCFNVTITFIARGGVEDPRLEAKAKSTKKFRGQGQTLSRPRTKDTGASVLQKKKIFKNFFQAISKKVFKFFFQAKKVFKIFFSGNFHLKKTKIGLRKFFARFLALADKISTVQKIVLSSSRGQGSFRGLEASRPSQELQNLSLRTFFRPRTWSRTPLLFIAICFC